MRLRTALACGAFLLVVFTIAVWSSPLLNNENQRGLNT